MALTIAFKTSPYGIVCDTDNAVCGYGDKDLLSRKSNAFLVFSALLESITYLILKYAQSVPTVVLVFMQSLCSIILGALMVSTYDVVELIQSFPVFMHLTSIGVMGFCTSWTFVRGTLLVSVGTACFSKITMFIIFSVAVQTAMNGSPNFYCLFGICIVALSVALMLIEKFSKFQ